MYSTSTIMYDYILPYVVHHWLRRRPLEAPCNECLELQTTEPGKSLTNVGHEFSGTYGGFS